VTTKLIHTFGCLTSSEKRPYRRRGSFSSRSARDFIFPVRKPRPRGAYETTATPRSLAVAMTKWIERGKDSHGHVWRGQGPGVTSTYLSSFLLRRTIGWPRFLPPQWDVPVISRCVHVRPAHEGTGIPHPLS